MNGKARISMAIYLPLLAHTTGIWPVILVAEQEVLSLMHSVL